MKLYFFSILSLNIGSSCLEKTERKKKNFLGSQKYDERFILNAEEVKKKEKENNKKN